MASSDTISVTLLSQKTGSSEVLPSVSLSSTVAECLSFAQALLGEDSIPQPSLLLDGRRLSDSHTLQQAGVKNGDMLVLQSGSTANSTPSSAPAAGGLDFSSLLANAPAPSPTLTATPTTSTAPGNPVYYEGMHLDDAIAYNPHPLNIVQLFREKEHLFKELRYHSPKLAAELQAATSLDHAATLWRQNIVQGSIKRAMESSTSFHKEKQMKERLANNPEDPEAVAYFRKQDNSKQIQDQYRQVMQEYPESFSKVLMLYISATINGHSVQAFCDSGAQMTIMSKKLATACGLADWIDERFAGIASGVGTGKILGRVHLAQLQVQDRCTNKSVFVPCTLTVMEDAPEGAKEMPFLLGLDMMKRHLCQLDLEQSVLKFRVDAGRYVEVPFLHEKDLGIEQGGTKGFDAEQANAMLLEDDDGDKKAKANDKNNWRL